MSKFKPSETLIQTMRTVWGQIGGDVMSCAEECGETVTHAECVESCVDADRLTSLGGRNGAAADTEFRAAVQAHGYPAVLKALCSAVTPKLA